MNTPPEITDPLLKSLSEDALDLPRMAALEARKASERKSRRSFRLSRPLSPLRFDGRDSFNPLAGLAWLMRFRVAQAAVALLILAAMIEGGSLITGERFGAPRKRGVDLLSAPTVTTKSGSNVYATAVVSQTTLTGKGEGLAGESDAPVGDNSYNIASGAVLQFSDSSGSFDPNQVHEWDLAKGQGEVGNNIRYRWTSVNLNGVSPSLAGAGTFASGTQPQDLYDAGRVNANNSMESHFGGAMGPKSLIDPAQGTNNGTPLDSMFPVLEAVVSGTSARSAGSGATTGGTWQPTQYLRNSDLHFNYTLGTGNIGNIRYSGGNTVSSNGNQTWALNPAPTSPLTINGVISGTSGFTTVGNGTVALNGGRLINAPVGSTSVVNNGVAAIPFGVANGSGTFAGTITNSFGTTNIVKTGAGSLQIDAGATSDVWNGSNVRVDALTGSGTVTRNGYTAASAGDWVTSTNWKDQTSTGQVVPIPPGADQDRLYSPIEDLFFSGTKTGGDGKKDKVTAKEVLSSISLQGSSSSNSVGGNGNLSLSSVNIGKSRFFLAQNQIQRSVASEPAQPATPPLVDARKLIRNAALDFEVVSFDSSLDTVGKVAGEEQGYILTQNSEKGPNGKLRGTIIVKVLPGNLDRFLLKLRALGDMKNQTVTGNDVTKDYYDTEARIRNSQVTEERLIEMMKTRTGKVSDLLEVENEIAKVRGEIEQMQGQLKYYDGLVQYATVTITLQEKDINQTGAYLLQERAQLSLFAKDVEAAFAEAKSDAAEAKAQTLDSHIERNESGQEVATLHLLLPPDSSDLAILKLKAIGRIQNFNSQTQRVAKDDGSGSAPSDTAKVDRDKVDISILIQRDAENAVQGTNISVQTDQVDAKTNEIKKAAAEEGVEIKGAEFNRMQNGVEISAMLLRMPMKKYGDFIERIKALGKVKDFTVARREDATATGDAPAEIVLQIFSQGSIIAPDTGLWATVRHTLGEGMAALMWSVRMIGVSLAFVLPWVVILALAAWVVIRRRRMARGSGK